MPTSQKPGPYYTAPAIVPEDARDGTARYLAGEKTPTTLVTLVVGSDLVLTATLYPNPKKEARIEVYDADANYIGTLMTLPGGFGIGLTSFDALTLCVPTAVRLFPNHLLTEQD